MTTDEKIDLISRNLEEVLTEDELKALIDSNTPLRHYIGFEISGKVHLGTGLATLLKVKDLHDAGAETLIWLADWHGWINNKLDGSLETAQEMAREYFQEGIKAAYICIGGDPNSLKFKQGSELYNNKPGYWVTMIKVAKATTISRMIRSTTIMGKIAGDSSPSANLIYPAMQAADIFTLGVNIAHAGTDQRNVHIVARDSAREAGYSKPVAIHHHLLQGLLKPNIDSENNENIKIALKMSKSKPDSAVFIHDTPEEIKRKINAAYAPEGVLDLNPILDWTKHLIFYNKTSFTVERDEKWGGNLVYTRYEDLEKDYSKKKLHPQDLKIAVAEWLIKKLEPARKYFENRERREALEKITFLNSKIAN
jgi:tyrosyl-tRNA synthetase